MVFEYVTFNPLASVAENSAPVSSLADTRCPLIRSSLTSKVFECLPDPVPEVMLDVINHWLDVFRYMGDNAAILCFPLISWGFFVLLADPQSPCEVL